MKDEAVDDDTRAFAARAAALTGETVQNAFAGNAVAKVTVHPVGVAVPVVNCPPLLALPPAAPGGAVPHEESVGSAACTKKVVARTRLDVRMRQVPWHVNARSTFVSDPTAPTMAGLPVA